MFSIFEPFNTNTYKIRYKKQIISSYQFDIRKIMGEMGWTPSNFTPDISSIVEAAIGCKLAIGSHKTLFSEESDRSNQTPLIQGPREKSREP